MLDYILKNIKKKMSLCVSNTNEASKKNAKKHPSSKGEGCFVRSKLLYLSVIRRL